MHPVHNQHLDTDKAQYESQAVFEENKRSAKSASKKYMARRPKMAKNVGSEDDERVRWLRQK